MDYCKKLQAGAVPGQVLAGPFRLELMRRWRTTMHENRVQRAGPVEAGQSLIQASLAEIDWEAREINRLTQKRKKRVVLPISQELLFALEAERGRRRPEPDERILVNPYTGDPMTRPRLYQRMLAVGKRAGVPDAHPHRYRDTFAVDMLARGASPYDVAKLLGDTVATVERHYAPFVKELWDRTRRIMETGEGLEKTDCTKIAQSEASKGRIK